jgi:hypothetical protein
MDSVDSLIATLNNLEIGDLGAIRTRLRAVREELTKRGFGELVEKLDECLAALDRGDLGNFRRHKATLVSRLGHLR